MTPSFSPIPFPFTKQDLVCKLGAFLELHNFTVPLGFPLFPTSVDINLCVPSFTNKLFMFRFDVVQFIVHEKSDKSDSRTIKISNQKKKKKKLISIKSNDLTGCLICLGKRLRLTQSKSDRLITSKFTSDSVINPKIYLTSV